MAENKQLVDAAEAGYAAPGQLIGQCRPNGLRDRDHIIAPAKSQELAIAIT